MVRRARADKRSFAGVGSEVASALGVQEVPGRPLLETLLEYLKDKSLLLILDNCEHVSTEAARIAHALLADCPRVRILTTRREPLRAAGERAYRLPSLTLPSPEAAARVTATEAGAYGGDRALFRSCSGHRPSLRAQRRERAGRGRALPAPGRHSAGDRAGRRPSELLIGDSGRKEARRDRFRILAGGERTALPRQQTMRETIDWSYELLAAAEKRVFERLSIFAGGCTLTSAEAVCAGNELPRADVVDLHCIAGRQVADRSRSRRERAALWAPRVVPAVCG